MKREKKSSVRKVLAIVFLFSFFLSPMLIQAQSVGINIAIPDPSAVLDIVSTKGGVLIPRMTSQEIADIVNPADGLLVYNTETKNTIMIVQGVSYDLYNPNVGSIPNYSVTMLAGGGATIWAGINRNTPEEFFGNTINRVKMDLTNATELRIMTNVSSFLISIVGRELVFALQYSSDNGATWDYLNSAGSGPTISISSAGFQVSNWFAIDPGAKGDVILRLVGNSPGVLALGASFGLTTIEAR